MAFLHTDIIGKKGAGFPVTLDVENVELSAERVTGGEPRWFITWEMTMGDTRLCSRLEIEGAKIDQLFSSYQGIKRHLEAWSPEGKR